MQGQNAVIEDSGNSHSNGVDTRSVVPHGHGGSNDRAPVIKLPTAAASEAAALISLIERLASDPSADVDRIERMYAMYERAAARNARGAYDDAMAAMQPDLPVIEKRGKGNNGNKYALWEDIAEEVLAVTGRHGFSLTFRVKPTDKAVDVTAVLSHRDGHREETSFPFPLDTTGNKNPIQAVGSSISYGKRYTACALLNVVARGEDDDGGKGAGQTITDDQAEQIKEALERTGAELPRFCAYYKLEKLTDLPSSKFASAMQAIEASAKKRSVQ
jgi:hypothetical protein